MMKKIRLLAALLPILLLWLLMGSVPAFAAAMPQEGDYDCMIRDSQGLLNEREKEALMDQMQELNVYGNMVFQTVELHSGINYERYAEESYYDLYGNEPGVLFQIDMGNRKLTISCSTEMEAALGKERDSIVDNVYRMASNQEYYACASEVFLEVYKVLHGEVIAHDMKHIDNAILALITALVLNFAFIFITTKKEVTEKDILEGVAVTAAVTGASIALGKKRERYSPRSSGSGGGGGGHSGGGGGGGFSGGSSSHGF